VAAIFKQRGVSIGVTESFSDMTKTTHSKARFNGAVSVCAGVLLTALILLPSAFVAKFSFTGETDWLLAVFSIVVTFAAFVFAHLPATKIWMRQARHTRPIFIAFVLAPTAAGMAVAILFSSWTMWATFLLVAFALDDIYTAAIAVGLPGGGIYNEVQDGANGRWIEVVYPDHKEFFKPNFRIFNDH